jgi:tRNA-specific 2-thiouridylase
VQNRVVLCPNEALFSNTLTARDINLISVERLDRPMRVKAKVRYRQEAQWATAEQTDETHFRLRFESGQRAVAKGQAVVLYEDDYVVGGGTIDGV